MTALILASFLIICIMVISSLMIINVKNHGVKDYFTLALAIDDAFTICLLIAVLCLS